MVAAWEQPLLADVKGWQMFEELEAEWVGHTQDYFVVVRVGSFDMFENQWVGRVAGMPLAVAVHLQSDMTEKSG